MEKQKRDWLVRLEEQDIAISGVIGQNVCPESSPMHCPGWVQRGLKVLFGTFKVGQNVCPKRVGGSYCRMV